MEMSILENGKIVICMGMEFIPGKMVLFTVVNIFTARNMEKESLFLQLAIGIRDIGKMVLNKEQESYLTKTVMNCKRDNGIKDNIKEKKKEVKYFDFKIIS